MRELPGKWTLRLRRATRYVPTSGVLGLVISLVSLAFSATTLYSELHVERGLSMYVIGFHLKPPLEGETVRDVGRTLSLNTVLLNSGERDAMVTKYSFQVTRAEVEDVSGVQRSGPMFPEPIIVKTGAALPIVLNSGFLNLVTPYQLSNSPVAGDFGRAGFKVMLNVEAVDDQGNLYITRWFVGNVSLAAGKPNPPQMWYPDVWICCYEPETRTLPLFTGIKESGVPPVLAGEKEGPAAEAARPVP